jgi:peptidoglycan-associated lipoprotein
VRKTNRLSAFCLALAAIAFTACPDKRPPAILTAPPPSETPTEEEKVAETGESSAEIASIEGEEASAADLPEETGPLADVHFGYDQYSLTDLAQSILDGHSAWLRAHPDEKLTIEGHCDERGTVEYNLALGDRRAGVVRDFLAQSGIDSYRLSTASFGKERPIDTGHDEEAWARNRRAHFIVRR